MWHQTSTQGWAAGLLAMASCFSWLPSVVASPPAAPELSFLYTAYVECEGDLMDTSIGPHGQRKAIPIVGGNFTGPHLSGKIENVGADWGLTDPRTNIFSADTRYNLRTDDGADIFIQTAGPKAPDGHLHLRLIFETGSPKYYWLNNVLAIGVLTSGLPSNGNLKVLRIDAWNFASDWSSTNFVNSTSV
ncbi:hypothetical protein N7541_003565 [Penicillium brevicompactum]|uniref:Scytalone dehydratase n=1 Tax=Penicillium brevicompactum TaxID=5074 RepID=A0A9W9US35_PENBR|nr:hypothetical protein N7452_001725 [Penicillium brevicompactum]KAJ5362721.1 hypothetical protein N7541_003565 [Penicillium brevicompactum]